jgi:Zn-dependent protease with chaperone function
MAIGIRHRAIVLPALADTWSGDMRRAVLRHEFAHVARRDCVTQAAAAFAFALLGSSSHVVAGAASADRA